MKWLDKFAKAANDVLMVLITLVAGVMLMSGLYVLNDILYTNRAAFISYDLLQYRPKAQEKDETGDNGFENLQKINPDTVGWIEMFGTNINYPVVQGNDNLEYINKDIFGYSTASGSIYLAAENNSDFSDWYNLFYGHHMDSGAMFGDIEKYLDPEFFRSHTDGIIQTKNGNYSIHVFACVRTNAYEETVYQLETDAEDRYPELKKYMEEHAVNHTEIPDNVSDGYILGMSTCTNAVTDGRIVLFAKVTPWDNAKDGVASQRITTVDTAAADTEQLNAVGHKMQEESWAFLNLMCLIFTLLTVFPLWSVKRKFGQFTYSRKMYHKLEKQINDEQNDDKQDEDGRQKTIRDLRSFIRKGHIGIRLEIGILIISAAVFFITEDISGRMVIRDSRTGLMILIAAAALIVDFICLRYRGKLPEETETGEDAQNKPSYGGDTK